MAARNREHARQTGRRKKVRGKFPHRHESDAGERGHGPAAARADARDARGARVETSRVVKLTVADDPQIDPDDPDSEERCGTNSWSRTLNCTCRTRRTGPRINRWGGASPPRHRRDLLDGVAGRFLSTRLTR